MRLSIDDELMTKAVISYLALGICADSMLINSYFAGWGLSKTDLTDYSPYYQEFIKRECQLGIFCNNSIVLRQLDSADSFLKAIQLVQNKLFNDWKESGGSYHDDFDTSESALFYDHLERLRVSYVEHQLSTPAMQSEKVDCPLPTQCTHHPDALVVSNVCDFETCRVSEFVMLSSSEQQPVSSDKFCYQFSGVKFCYQCDKRVLYLFQDGRCKDCTRLTPEEVQGLSLFVKFKLIVSVFLLIPFLNSFTSVSSFASSHCLRNEKHYPDIAISPQLDAIRARYHKNCGYWYFSDSFRPSSITGFLNLPDLLVNQIFIGVPKAHIFISTVIWDARLSARNRTLLVGAQS
jgi:hypothetical protein